jgi:hypothetical protein
MVETINDSAAKRNEVIDQLTPGASAEFTVQDTYEYDSIKNALKYRRRVYPDLSFTAKKKGDKVTVTRHA